MFPLDRISASAAFIALGISKKYGRLRQRVDIGMHHPKSPILRLYWGMTIISGMTGKPEIVVTCRIVMESPDRIYALKPHGNAVPSLSP